MKNKISEEESRLLKNYKKICKKLGKSAVCTDEERLEYLRLLARAGGDDLEPPYEEIQIPHDPHGLAPERYYLSTPESWRWGWLGRLAGHIVSPVMYRKKIREASFIREALGDIYGDEEWFSLLMTVEEVNKWGGMVGAAFMRECTAEEKEIVHWGDFCEGMEALSWGGE